MTIVAGGDSFVFGSELADCGQNTPSNNTFPALLSRSIDRDYFCVANPGLSNDGIARQVIMSCENLRNELFVIVSWTFPGRYEFRFSYDTMQRGKHWNAITPWTIETNIENKINKLSDNSEIVLETHTKMLSTAKTTGLAEFAEVFYKHVGSTSYWEIYSSLKEITYLQNYLKVKNIPYMFTCADNVIINNEIIDSNDVVIASLYKQIDFSKWFLFPEGTNPNDTKSLRGFYQWAVENKYTIGTTHPLEEAHKDAAELMKVKFNELVKKSVQQN